MDVEAGGFAVGGWALEARRAFLAAGFGVPLALGDFGGCGEDAIWPGVGALLSGVDADGEVADGGAGEVAEVTFLGGTCMAALLIVGAGCCGIWEVG